jgi:beta-phosphoglucomutase-like phosphatase (HAD superfamily)
MEKAGVSEALPVPAEQAAAGSSRWTWHRGPLSGAAVVFDLDGVLSDAAARQHYLRGPRPDWESFFSASGEDPLIDEVATLLGLLADDLAIVLLTARPARTGELTVGWLGRHEVRWDLLVMRRDRDYRPARQFKQEAVRDMRARGLDLKLCVEDDLRNVEMFRAEGLPALYIHSGYYE